MSSLLPLKEGRPAVLTIDGWVVFVSIHDAEYLRMVKQWKRRLAAAHPDHGGSARKFRVTHAARTRWLMQEATWYAKLGLLPPDGSRAAAVRLERIIRLKGQIHGTGSDNHTE